MELKRDQEMLSSCHIYIVDELGEISLFLLFVCRYPPHGRRAMAIETGVTWDRLRVPPLDTSPHDLYISDCLTELCPGDHIEIQWRRNKEFPYGLFLYKPFRHFCIFISFATTIYIFITLLS